MALVSWFQTNKKSHASVNSECIRLSSIIIQAQGVKTKIAGVSSDKQQSSVNSVQR